MEHPNEIILTDEMVRELPRIKAKTLRNGTFMKAPNGKPSRLNELTWLVVRTLAYKRMFGDWELQFKKITIATAPKEHGFENFAAARKWARENIVRTYNDEETGGKGEIRISRKAIEKFTSETSVNKSEDKDIHMSVLIKLPELIREGVEAESHPDYKKDRNGFRSVTNGINKNVTMHRVYSAAGIGDSIYRVKITLKEDRTQGATRKTYNYEATKIELLAGQTEPPVGDSRNSNNSISVAKLLNGVEKSYEKGKKLLEDYSVPLDANGEPYGQCISARPE